MRNPLAVVGSFTAVLVLSAGLAGQDGAQPGEAELRKIAIDPGSALGKLKREAEGHEAANKVLAAERAVAAVGRPVRRRTDIPDWLRAHYRRNHPQALAARIAGPPDPTEGLPLALESLYIWMLQHQDLRPPVPPANPLRAAAASVEAGPDVRISGRNVNPNSESDIRINPGNLSQIIAGSNNISGSQQAQFFSTDGGATWGQTLLPLLAGDSLHSDPTVDWASDGTAWATTIGIAAGSTVLQMRAYRSTDSGKTWAFDGTFSGDQTATDKQMVWIDRSPTSRFKDTIYAIWHNNKPVFVNRRASDGWQEPQQVSKLETTGTGIGGDITTNAKGDVFAAWPDTGSRNIFLVKSVDGGEKYTDIPIKVTPTFAAFDIGVPAFAERRILVYASIAAFSADSRDDVYVTWTDLSGESQCGDPTTEPGTDVNSPCKSRVWFRRSTDGGVNWEPARKINDPADRNDQFNQKLAVDSKTGNLGVVYYQTGTGGDRKKTNLFFQASIDRGGTWSKPTKISTATTDETTSTADLNQYGDYNGLSVADGVFFPSWTDRRDNQVEAIFTARIRLKTNTDGVVEPELIAGPAPVGGGGSR